MQEKGHSQRHACGLVGLDPKSYRYASRRSDDMAIRARLKDLANERRRFGYRRLHLLLRREGVMLNHKKLFRLYREERLSVRRRSGRKRALGTRAPMALPQDRTSAGVLDFVSDILADGRRFRVLVVLTTLHENAWRLLWTHRYQVSASLASLPRRTASDDRQRQRHGADLPSNPGMAGGSRR